MSLSFRPGWIIGFVGWMAVVFNAPLAASSLPAAGPVSALSPDSDEDVMGKNQEEILAEADGIFAEVSRLRGLPIKHPVQKAFKNREFFRNYFYQLLLEKYPPEKQAAYEKAYALLGLLPEKTDLIQTYLDSFLKVVDGLYDPKTKTLYIADWISSDHQEETLAHELTHALQDQYFDLQAYMDRGKDDTMDEQFARASVMEGEATAVALDYSMEDRGTDFTQLVNIAEWVRTANLLEASGKRAFGRRVVLNDIVDFPYVYGAAFLQRYVKRYGWPGMSYLFEKPPTSTHQVMHPETFFPRRHEPLRVELEDLSLGPLEGTRKIWENCFGEYGLFTLLRQYLPAEEASSAVSGWRGDDLQVYEDRATGRLMLAAYVVFETAPSADSFFESYRSLLGEKYDLDTFIRSDDSIHWAAVRNSGEQVYLEKLGKRVVFIEGTLPRQTPKVRQSLWDVVALKAKAGKPRPGDSP